MSNQTNQDQQPKAQAVQTSPPARTNLVNNQRISRRQFFFIIIQTQIGVGILSLPFELHQVAKQDGWISLIIGGLLLQIILFVLWWIAKSHPNRNFFQINEKLLTKWVGKVVSFSFVLYFICVGILIILLFGRMISLWVLPNTPFWVLAFLMIAISMYMACCGLNVIGRLYTVLSFLLVFLVVLMAYSMKEMRIMYLFPMAESWGRIWSGVNNSILSFLGFIVTLVVFPNVEGKPKDILKTIFYAHWFVLLFYLYIVFVCFTFFSTEEIALVPEPLLYIMKSFEFEIIARIDLFFITIWIVSVATSYTTYVHMASVGLSEIFQSNKIKLFHIIIAFTTFIAACLMGFNMSRLEAYGRYVVQSGYGFSILFPFILLIVSIILGKFRTTRREKNG